GEFFGRDFKKAIHGWWVSLVVFGTNVTRGFTIFAKHIPVSSIQSRHPEVRGAAAPRRMHGREGATSAQAASHGPSPFEARRFASSASG
ncbi:MAG TPA: hypothetical protein VE087_02600, partial [Xanthobacteraceae bacterium]|nr:hypothetical protein [Xanthobacteraceae bacterium]